MPTPCAPGDPATRRIRDFQLSWVESAPLTGQRVLRVRAGAGGRRVRGPGTRPTPGEGPQPRTAGRTGRHLEELRLVRRTGGAQRRAADGPAARPRPRYRPGLPYRWPTEARIEKTLFSGIQLLWDELQDWHHALRRFNPLPPAPEPPLPLLRRSLGESGGSVASGDYRRASSENVGRSDGGPWMPSHRRTAPACLRSGPPSPPGESTSSVIHAAFSPLSRQQAIRFDGNGVTAMARHPLGSARLLGASRSVSTEARSGSELGRREVSKASLGKWPRTPTVNYAGERPLLHLPPLGAVLRLGPVVISGVLGRDT